MRKTPYSISGILKVVVLGVVGSVASISSAAVLDLTSTSDTSPWRALMSGSVYYQDTGGKTGNNTGIDDQQTGQAVSDIVGDASTAAAGYVSYGTINGTQYIGFRVRLNKVGTDLASLNQMTYALIDVNRDGNIDLAVGGEAFSGTGMVVIVDATGTSGNTGPSNSTLLYGNSNTALFSYTGVNTGATTANLTYLTAAEATTFSGDADALISFAVPFADFVAAVKNVGVMGSAYSFDATSSYNVVIATSNNKNNINQDTMASMATGVVFKFGDTITSDGVVSPIPEPSTVIVFGALMAPVLVSVVRRQLRERAKLKQTA